MTTRMIRLDRLTDAQRGAWRELAANAAEPNPFFEQQLLEPAWRNLRPRGLALLVAEDSAGWSACLPVQHVRWPAYAMTGWNHPYAFLSTPLLRGEDPARAAEQLVAPFRGRRTALLSLRLVGCGPAGTALRAAARGSGLTCAWGREIDRAAAWRHDGEPRVPLSARRRAKLRKQGQRLSELLGAELRVDERAGDAAALERFLALEAAGWKGEQQTALAANRAHRAFFLEMATGLAAEGRLRLSTLSAGDDVLAMSCNLRSGDAMFGFKSAFDERYRRYAPGIQLMFETVRAFHAEGDVRLFDSCSESDSSLPNEVYGERIALTSFVLAARGAPAELTRSTLQAGIAARARLRFARAAAQARARADRTQVPSQ
ncbi:GNAT family N-acetyltransferase [Conexibacter woesei]|nr:GNAT family N-acetyltransferase [Conexibacter woesei]